MTGRPPRTVADARTTRFHSRGATLIEAMVALAFAGVFAALVYSFSRSCLQSMAAQQGSSDAQETSHLALELIMRDLRQAGFNGGGEPIAGITYASSSRVAVQFDWNGDGDCTDANEAVAYGVDAAGVTLTRAFGDAPPQPLIDHLSAGSFRLEYFDAADSALLPGDSGLNAAQRQAVRRVGVTFTVAVPSLSPLQHAPTERTVSGTVILRNVPIR